MFTSAAVASTSVPADSAFWAFAIGVCTQCTQKRYSDRPHPNAIMFSSETRMKHPTKAATPQAMRYLANQRS